MIDEEGLDVGGGDRAALAVDGSSETSREDISAGLESGELAIVESALIGVLGISSSTGSSLGNGRFGDGAATAVSAIVSVMAGSCDIRWIMKVIAR